LNRITVLDFAPSGGISECSALAKSHAQCVLRVAPDWIHLFLLPVVPADVERAFGEMRGILVHGTKNPFASDFDGLIEND
jgi:hypothetical protein